MANEKSKIPPPPKERRTEESGNEARPKDCPPPPTKVKEYKDFSSLKEPRQASSSRKGPESEPPSGKTKKSGSAQIYACPLCPKRFESSQQRYIHSDGESSGIPDIRWRGEREHNTFKSVIRNARKQDQSVCEGYVWTELPGENYVPTKVTPVPNDQKCSFDGSDNIVVEHTGKIIQTRFEDKAARDKQSRSSWYQWKNPEQQADKKKGWFSGSSNKPKAPNPPDAPASTATVAGSQQVPEVPEAPILVEDAPETDAAQEAAQTAAAAPPIDPAAQLEQITAPRDGVALEQAHSMIFQSWQCLGQHMFGAQHANVLIEARMAALLRFQQIHDKLSESPSCLFSCPC
eukprot:3274420-Amphidinium_carterae.1